MNANPILTYMQQHLDLYLAMLQQIVELETPSHESKIASDRCSRYLEETFSQLGFRTQFLRQQTCGDHVYGELGSGPKSILFVGHYDTVFPLGTLKTMPFKTEAGKAYGPGILDMKGGIVMTYWALRALCDLGLMPQDKTIGVFFNSDEESGSFCSSDLILEKAKEYQCVFVMEPGIKDINSVKTCRYGRGTYTLTVQGKSAHSGSNPHLALSPFLELSEQLLRIDRWGKESTDATFAPTAISGGIEGTCRIPETAKFTMDVRFKTEAAARSVHKMILDLQPILPGYHITVSGKIDKPVMIGDPDLFRLAAGIGEHYGLSLHGVTIGGGSDGNFTAAAGIPTLDGIGTTGEFLHNPKEYICIDHVPPRTSLIAELIQTL